MLRLVLFELLFLSTCAYALWRGGAPERIAAATFLVAATLTTPFRLPTLRTIHPLWIHFRAIEIWVATVDVGVFVAMLWLAMISQRFWPIWMTAMAGIVVFIHLSMLVHLDALPWAYWRSTALWSYPMQILLAAATWRHHARRMRDGADPSWKRSSSR